VAKRRKPRSERTEAQPRAGPGHAEACAKRLIDIVGSLLALLLLAPMMGLAAVAIVLDSRGPVFYTQERAGKNGHPFTMFKLRTMVVNAEQLLDELIDLDALDEPMFKIKDDPRITRVGRVLRRWSIDEVPQLFNVLRGEMSLVGPRPEESRIVARYGEWHRERLKAKPGITGPMQVNGRGDLPFEERARLEIDYIEHYTLVRDLCILIRTIPAVLRGDGAY
jgi:lipopolysaccharide/colanic/teichoic acid biosynthesis glycosyltransferase